MLVATVSLVVSLVVVEVTVCWVLVKNSKLPPPVIWVSLMSWIAGDRSPRRPHAPAGVRPIYEGFQ